ncbi:MAG: GMC oxidoreductase, partial [Brachymonas sp.]
FTTRSGPMASNSITAQAFVPLPGEDPYKAEVKLQIQQVSTPGNRGKARVALDDHPGATLASFQIRPYSRGSCHISSRDPQADPRMISNHFSDARDIEACLRALKMSRQLAATPALSKYLLEEIRPSGSATSDESLVAYLRATGATAYHPLGTCRIGADAFSSVVDAQLRVHGVQGLRVADGSVCPSIAATNTNAICIVIGERVAQNCLEAQV